MVPVFERAFTFGRVTDELRAEPSHLDAWVALVDQVTARRLSADGPS